MKKHKHNVNYTNQAPRMNEQELGALNAMNPQLANYLLITYGAATLRCISGCLTQTRDAIYDLDEII